jgi:hypothetical protein
MEYGKGLTRIEIISKQGLAFWLRFLLAILFFCPAAKAYTPLEDCPKPYECYWTENLYYDIKRDFTVYLRPKNLLYLGDAFVVGAILANTRIDRSIRNTWQNSIRSSGTNNFFAVPEAIGGFSYWYHLVYPGAVALGYYTRNSVIGNAIYFWGYRSLRTALLGGIQQAIFTQALGSGRPLNNVDSKWQPYRYKTGVSGHAFYGSIPFLTAAMMSDIPLIRYGLYVLSTLPGIARINSDHHYTSQVVMGWSIAFLSARAVYQSDMENEFPWTIQAYPYQPCGPCGPKGPPGVAVSAHYQF